jgi:HK97 family phage major capsid protein
MNIKELLAQLSALAKKANEKAAEFEGKDMPEEVTTEIKGYIAEMETLKDRIEDAKKLQAHNDYLGKGTGAPAAQAGMIASNQDKEHDPVPGTMGFKSFGEQLVAVRKAAQQGVMADPRLVDTKATGLSEGVPADGGFLVQEDFSATLLQRLYAQGELLSRVTRIPISANSNRLKINTIDESSRADGSRWGGVLAYWKAEAAEKTASKTKFAQLQLELNKLIGLCYATDELLADAAALEAIISMAFQNEFTFQVEDAIINGDGSGKPLGILNSPCLVSVAKESGQTADTVVTENIFKMWSRMWAPSRANAVWLINQDIEPQLFAMYLAVGTGGVPVYLPANGVADSPFGRLMGRPVIPVEHCQTLGDKGDIILADLSQYLMIEKGGMETASSIHVKFVYDETAYRFVMRTDGQPSWKSALTPAHGSNTLSPFVTLAERA